MTAVFCLAVGWLACFFALARPEPLRRWSILGMLVATVSVLAVAVRGNTPNPSALAGQAPTLYGVSGWLSNGAHIDRSVLLKGWIGTYISGLTAVWF